MTHLKNLLSKKYTKYTFGIFFMIAGTCFAGQQDSDVVSAIIQILNIIFALVTLLLTPAIILSGWLLSPDWTMGD
ncbi:hypothetical protein, partial [Leuconostoc suionicum]|uniref:hypothetical protein n=1 Tax=Leuconostoc suionicum TaxID=1511761 RepID=UPI00300CBF70